MMRVTIICDSCLWSETLARTAWKARAKLKDQGWVHIGRRGGQDYCSGCWEGFTAQERAMLRSGCRVTKEAADD